MRTGGKRREKNTNSQIRGHPTVTLGFRQELVEEAKATTEMNAGSVAIVEPMRWMENTISIAG